MRFFLDFDLPVWVSFNPKRYRSALRQLKASVQLAFAPASGRGVHIMHNDRFSSSFQSANLMQSDCFAANDFLKGLRVLLVDDSPDNQALMKRFLETSCAIVDVACNGAEAVEVSRVKKFDVILMDMQMPILDGYEASRALRAEGYFVPIVALTAHAMCGEREKCIAAGCVEYISKPVNQRTLVEVVGRVAKKKLVDFPSPSSNIETHVPGTLVACFLENLPIRVAQLHQAQERQNWQEVARLAHQMAGAAGGYGFPEIGRIAAEIEGHAVRHQNPSVLGDAILAFNSLCHRAIENSKLALSNH